MTTADTPTEPTPGWVVAVLGVLLLPLAVAAFTLSFVQLLPVMLFGGWDTSTAWLGPVVLDVTAVAGAVMHVVSLDPKVRAWGLGLLAGGTVLSIAGNLAGHSIRTPGNGARVPLPQNMTGWTLPEGYQWVLIALSVAVPLAVAVLVHAFGAVLTAWLTTQPASDSGSVRPDSTHPTLAVADPTLLSDSTRLDPTRASDSDPTVEPTGPDPVGQSGAEPQPTDPTPDPTRLASESTADLRESGESGTRPDSDSHPTPDPTADPTDLRVGYPTDPTGTRPDPANRPDSGPDSRPTESADPTLQPPDPTRPATRPDSESGADPTDPELTRLVARARELIESGQAKPTVDSLRPALSIGQAKAREVRDALKHNQRHGLRAVS